MFASGSVCVSVTHLGFGCMYRYFCVRVSAEQSGSDEWTCDFYYVCASAGPHVFQPLSRVLSVYVGVFAGEGLPEERSIKLLHSLSPFKCVTCFTDEF